MEHAAQTPLSRRLSIQGATDKQDFDTIVELEIGLTQIYKTGF